MEETLREELLGKTKHALDADDWETVERLWQPWIEQGDAEAEFQLAYHYLWCTRCDDDATTERMEALVGDAAAKDHPDALWLLAMRLNEPQETNPEFERLLRRAGQLGSVHAYRALGAMYATGEWTGPQDLAEAVRWYRLGAERGQALSQYDLGFMLLLGEGAPKNTSEGLMWLERAGEQEEHFAYQLLVDCYENGQFDVSPDAEKAALWRNRLEEYARLHPRQPSVLYSVKGAVTRSDWDRLWDIEGVTGFNYVEAGDQVEIFYDPAFVSPAELDEKTLALGMSALARPT